jgi:hypothetical protein
MIVHLHDFQGFDVDLDVPASSTIGDIRSLLQSEGLYDTLNAQFFKSGEEVVDSTSLGVLNFSGDNVIVVLKRGLFAGKSFPTDDPPREFGRSRLRDFFISKPGEPEPPQPAADLDLLSIWSAHSADGDDGGFDEFFPLNDALRRSVDRVDPW